MTALDLTFRFDDAGTYCSYDDPTLALATSMVRSYVRDAGCPDDDDGPWPDALDAVRYLVATRLNAEDFTRPRHSAEVAADYGEQFFMPFRGFSLAERLMLDRYRQRLM